MTPNSRHALPVLLAALWAGAAAAQGPAPGAAPGPAPLVVHFDAGSSAIRSGDMGVLDHASRAYVQGQPVVMIVSGATDATGDADANLRLSQARARNVLTALVSRGIPAGRFQLLAKGSTDPAVPDPAGAAEPEDRRVEISWR